MKVEDIELKEIFQIIELVYNEQKTYPGDLTHYFKLLWNSKGVKNPYHNLRHILHVFWHTYKALMIHKNQLTPLQIRTTLIAALLHDINHIGKCGKDYDDSMNILSSLNVFIENRLPEDDEILDDVLRCIESTKFPHEEKNGPDEWSLHAKLLRDVDTASTLHTTWIQQTIFGLGDEMNMTPEQMLKIQEPFLRSLKFETEWANNEYGPQIEKRIEEVQKMIKCLE